MSDLTTVANELRNRVRIAAAQQAWDDATEELESDDIAVRREAVEAAIVCLRRALRELDDGCVALADQAIADAMGEFA